MNGVTHAQITDALRQIAAQVDDPAYRNEVPYLTQRWWTEEDDGRFTIGCPDWSDRPALMFIVEAARNLCGMEHGDTLKLLRMAIQFIEDRKPSLREEVAR